MCRHVACRATSFVLPPSPEMDALNDMHILHHVESLRRKASYYWPDRREHSYLRWPPYALNDFRPALNIRALVSAFSPANDQDLPFEGESSTNGRNLRKRKHSESASGPSKRIKLGQAREYQQEAGEESDADADDDVKYRQIYPAFWDSPCDVIDKVDETEDTSFLQVYRFGINLQYNQVVDHGSIHDADDETATRLGWLKEEEALRTLLEDRQQNESLSRDIDMGRFFMTRYHGRLLGFSEQREGPFSRSAKMVKMRSDRWLFLLPDVPWPDGVAEGNLEEHDMQPSGVHRDFITACALLQSYCRVKLEARLQLHILSEGTYDPKHLPFELRAHFTLSLAMPEIYARFDDSRSRGEVSELEGLQRRLLCFLSKTPLSRPVHGIGYAMDEATSVTIPFFLNVMHPAPPLAQHMTYESLQPDGLLATLMPFQRRTVAWMLDREGKEITPEGTVAPLDASVATSSTACKRLPPLWEEIELGGRNFFLNRLTSALSPTPPEPHPALGGILAEEPGLLLFCNLCNCALTGLKLLIQVSEKQWNVSR